MRCGRSTSCEDRRPRPRQACCLRVADDESVVAVDHVPSPPGLTGAVGDLDVKPYTFPSRRSHPEREEAEDAAAADEHSEGSEPGRPAAELSWDQFAYLVHVARTVREETSGMPHAAEVRLVVSALPCLSADELSQAVDRWQVARHQAW